MVMLSLFGGGYVARFLWRALSTGFVPGKLGASHAAWSPQYTVSIAACVLALAICVALIAMGFRFAGLIRPTGNKKSDDV